MQAFPGIKKIGKSNDYQGEINLKIPNVKFFRNFDLLNRDKNIEAYIVATPVESHYEYISKIVNKNKPFILEKPIVANYEELKKIHKICKNYKHSIIINHIDLYNPTFLAFLKNLKSVGIYKKIDLFFGKNQKIKKFNIRTKKGKFFLPSKERKEIMLSIKSGGGVYTYCSFGLRPFR